MILSNEILFELLHSNQFDLKKENIIFDCPVCGKSNHAGLRLEENHRWNCFHCHTSGNIFSLLKLLNRLDLLGGKTIDTTKPLENKIKINEEKVLDLEVQKTTPPLSFKRIYESEYLDSRGWSSQDYKYFIVGESPRYYTLKEYITFLVLEEGTVKGYLSRCKKSKEWIKENKVPRYINGTGIDFVKLIYNLDHVTKQTKTVIITEGVTGVQNITKLLNLYNQEETIVVCSFGKKLSSEQIAKIQIKGPNIELVILLYDTDAVSESKQYSLDIEKYFNVLIGYFKNPEKDSGNVTDTELEEVFENLENSINFTLNKVSHQKLEPKIQKI